MPRPPLDDWIVLWLGVSGDGWMAIRRFGYGCNWPEILSNRFAAEAALAAAESRFPVVRAARA